MLVTGMAPCEREAASHKEEGSVPAGTLEHCPQLPGGPDRQTPSAATAQLGSRPDIFALWVRAADLTSNLWACFLTLRVRMRDFPGTLVVKTLPSNADVELCVEPVGFSGRHQNHHRTASAQVVRADNQGWLSGAWGP